MSAFSSPPQPPPRPSYQPNLSSPTPQPPRPNPTPPQHHPNPTPPNLSQSQPHPIPTSPNLNLPPSPLQSMISTRHRLRFRRTLFTLVSRCCCCDRVSFCHRGPCQTLESAVSQTCGGCLPPNQHAGLCANGSSPEACVLLLLRAAQNCARSPDATRVRTARGVGGTAQPTTCCST